jgi:hypothetical protein
MNHVEGLSGFFALCCFLFAGYKIVMSGDYSPVNLFVLGFGVWLIGQTVKALSDSNARDKFLKKSSND